jgi:hypothetical protein
MQNLTFVIKHIYGNANKVVDALSRRCMILQKFQVKTLGFEHLNEMYYDDPDFKEAYEACENLVLRDKSEWKKYMIQYGLLFKVIVHTTHSGGLARHFGHDKTFA